MKKKTIKHSAPKNTTPNTAQNLEGLQNSANPVATEWVTPTALDRYRLKFFGNKLFALRAIANLIPSGAATVADPFGGSGVVSWFLKHQGFKIISNDIMRYPALKLRALIGNNGTTLTSADVQMLCETNRHGQGYLTQYYANALGAENCQFLESWSANIQRLDNPVKKDIAVYACVYVVASNVPYANVNFSHTGILTGYQQHWLIDYRQEICEFALQEFPDFLWDNGQQNQCYNMDALDLVAQIDADVLYLDPPYAEARAADYEQSYGFYDKLVLALHSQGEMIVDPYNSKANLQPYTYFASRNSAVTGLARLFERSTHIPRTILSYNTTSGISVAEIRSIAAHSHRVIDVQYLKRPLPTARQGRYMKSGTEEILMVCEPRVLTCRVAQPCNVSCSAQRLMRPDSWIMG